MGLLNIIKIYKQYKLFIWLIFIILALIIAWYLSKNIKHDHWDELYNSGIISLTKTKPKKIIRKKFDNRCREIVQNYFGVGFPSVRPEFLKYKTGKNLELDMYNDDLKLAFEYQGIQHYKYTPMFHKSINDLYEQQERDKFKFNRCKELGITLIYIYPDIKFEGLENYLISSIKENYLKY